MAGSVQRNLDGLMLPEFHAKPSHKSFKFDSTAGVHPIGVGTLSLPIPTVQLHLEYNEMWNEGLNLNEMLIWSAKRD